MDFQHPTVMAYATEKTSHCEEDAVQKAVALYYAVRDDIRYNPYSPFHLPEHYRASRILAKGEGYCVAKAALLCAVGRAAGIPTRLGFATVRNHLATRQLIEYIGSDVFVYHGYAEFWLKDRWVIATPAFNKELCVRHGVSPLEFDGTDDSIFQAYNLENQKFMEYVEYHGSYADLPLEKIVSAWQQAYGDQRVASWIESFESGGGKIERDFQQEDVIKD